jgi:hypothetical protein
VGSMKRRLPTDSRTLALERERSDHYVKIKKKGCAKRRGHWILEMNGSDSG